MNCPTCGAENEADARFCAECGSPLEDQAAEAIKAERVFSQVDEDATIISSAGLLAEEEAKTLAVDQAQLSAALEDASAGAPSDDAPEPEPEPKPVPPAQPASGGSGGDQGESSFSGGGESGGGKNRTLMIVGIVAVVLLCCCCCSLAIGATIGSDPELLEDMIDELSMVSTLLLFV